MPPKMELGHVESPSPFNPLGMKGVGEAGAIPTPACFVQALETAFPECGLQILEIAALAKPAVELVQQSRKKK